MNLHEYQAKALLREYGLPVSAGIAVETTDAAVQAARELGGKRWVCKVQVHAGGRGKAGGVRLAESENAVRAFAERWLGARLVSAQTDAEGQLVSKIFVEEAADIDRELYLGAVVDRASRSVVVMASTEGGVEIEQVAAETPDKILRAAIDPALGAQPHQGRAMAFALGLRGKQVAQFTDIFLNLSRLFHERDCALMEVNPLVVTRAGDVHCLDAKINLDNNALYRQPALAALRDPTQEDDREAEAAEFGLNYVSLEGNIGCMVNGAGLAMGTMDLVKLQGGNPANFLDVGGGATEQAVAEAFKIILSDANVKTVLINIFGGIVSCKIIAEGIIAAVRQVGVQVPVVVRFEGNNAAAGLAALEASGLDIATAASLREAAAKAVRAATSVGETA